MTRAIGAMTAAAVFLAGGTALAQDRPGQRMVTLEEAPAWRAVGRLNISGNRYCTATLVAPDLVITAAHCIFHPLTRHRAHPAEIVFLAGFRLGDYAALRRAAAVAVLPGYRPGRGIYNVDPGNDVALLRIDPPIAAAEAEPIPVATWDGADPVSIVAYGEDRPQAASLREGCQTMDLGAPLYEISCSVVGGVSGAPVIRETPEGRRVVAVVVASGGTVASPSHGMVPAVGGLATELQALLAEPDGQ